MYINSPVVNLLYRIFCHKSMSPVGETQIEDRIATTKINKTFLIQ